MRDRFHRDAVPPFAKGGRGDFSGASIGDTPPNPAQPPLSPNGGFCKGVSRATRREFLLGLVALLGAPSVARAAAQIGEEIRLAATWQAGAGNRVGLLTLAGDNLRIATELELPTRAHGLLREPAGTLLTVARRPGDWLLRWDEQGRALAWRWVEPGRAFAGHLLASPDGATVYTTEIDLETGAGLIGVRDGNTLAKLAEWPTRGLDPHELLWDPTRPGNLIVANGGVPTRPETGRVRHDLDRMDSSLARLDAATGRIVDQWRLDDPRLSLRHLAWNGDRLGIALQAEHAEPSRRDGAPVLALLDNDVLRVVASPGLRGYGGSIAAHDDGFAVSCPRAQGVALYDAHGYRDFIALQEACALTGHANRLWAGGRTQALGNGGAPLIAGLPDIRLDNHWVAL
ncbi:MAG: DUF1513 domain-containing protein [Hydrogenophilales bacterium]|nr:DUF1513 domain-containing protein [Hydrogenophilales bacterium]